MKMASFFLSVVLIVALSACDSGPRQLDATAGSESHAGPGTSAGTGIFSDNAAAQPGTGLPPAGENIHTAVALEVLPTDKYVYVKMKEGEETYWIATIKQEVIEGKTYFFKDGLLKTQFESKEYNRVFDKIYLVSSIVSANHAAEQVSPAGGSMSKPAQDVTAVEKPITVPGSTPIADLVKNPEKFAGKEIQISGVCTKINPNIMGRNWIHLEDGTADDFDMVLTSDLMIPEGAVVSMKGTVTLNKDFGAGYRYDIIIENATMIK